MNTCFQDNWRMLWFYPIVIIVTSFWSMNNFVFAFLSCSVLLTLSPDSSRFVIMQYFFVYRNISHVALFNSPSGFVHLLLFPLLFFDISLQSLRNISVDRTSTLNCAKFFRHVSVQQLELIVTFRKSKGYAVGSNRGALPTRNMYQQD